MAFYGTLRPGGEHHYEVRGIAGEWYEATVRGWVYDITWGPADGYPGITIDPNAPHTTVDVLESDDLDTTFDASTSSRVRGIGASKPPSRSPMGPTRRRGSTTPTPKPEPDLPSTPWRTPHGAR